MSEINSRGNQVFRSFTDDPDRCRYDFDFEKCSAKDGWLQFDTDQDAWYFGVSVNKGLRHIITYAEGDITRVECPTIESFNAEIARMCKFYGEEASIRTIDLDGTYTKYYQDREMFYIREVVA